MKSEEFKCEEFKCEAFASAIKRYLDKHGFEALCPKAVLFDMDGVLYDSMPNHAVAWQESMRMFSIDMTRHDAYATEGQRGVDTIRQMALRQQGRNISMDEAQAMYEVKSHLFHLMPPAPMMPGAHQLMRRLRAAGLAVCVVTGSGQRPLIERLKRDYGDCIDEQHIVTAYDVEHGKPAPEPYLKGLEKCGGLNPWEAMVVENAPLGVEAAVAARIFTICVNTGSLPVELFVQRQADVIVDSMMQLNEGQWSDDCWFTRMSSR